MAINGVNNLTGVSGSILKIYDAVTAPLPAGYEVLVNLLFYTIIIFLFGMFVWKFYRFVAKRDILSINLFEYNKTEHPLWNKTVASFLYILEYIIIIPLLVIFWFTVLAVFFLLLSKSESADQILLISAAVVAAIRLASYYSNDLSKELSKMIPLTVLAIFLTQPNFFSINKMVDRFSQVPALANNILKYLVFIVVLEIFIRGVFVLIDLWISEEVAEVEKEAEEKGTKSRKIIAVDDTLGE